MNLFPKRQRGFSLIEISVVLGVAGAVTAGIWAVASSTRDNTQVMQAAQQTLLLVKNTRDYYSSRALPAAAISASTHTATLRAARVFPTDMCDDACVSSGDPKNVYSQAVTVAIPNITPTPINEIEIVYENMSIKACTALGARLTANAATDGLTRFSTDEDTHTTFPVLPSVLTATCDSGAGNEIDVTLRYRIRT